MSIRRQSTAKMKTRTFIFSAAITIFLLFFLILPGQPLSAEMPGEVRIFLNGKELLSDAPFLIEQGRTLVPVRVLLEAMGAEVDWDEEERRVYIYLDDLNIKLAAEANTFYINDRAVPLGMPARIIGGRVYIPLR